MRFIFGIIVGAALTVGAAYVHDSALADTTDARSQHYVNWPAVNDGWQHLSARVRSGWENLSGTVDRKLKSSRLHGANDV
ncbi:MAG: hypothetical protein QOD74_703 [Variibacter sp.]|nr:hypothetical protein [Variibacter sp.]